MGVVYKARDIKLDRFVALKFLPPHLTTSDYEGKTLKDKIKDKRLETKDAIDITVQITEGLARAHEEGITHRDIKPANIIITDREEVKILDFGLAKLAGQTQLTKEGSTLGTVAYMSPEQTQGHKVDHRSDIWSLGIVLYEALTGEFPFKGDYDQAVVYSILNEEPSTGPTGIWSRHLTNGLLLKK